jgi:LacI family transcriptional regulator
MVVTIRDVARLAGVSIATVSHALSGNRPVSPDMRARVVEAAEELGYRPNRVAGSMVTRKTGTLALIVPDIANPFFAAFVKSVEGSAIERGYTTVACSSERNGDLDGARGRDGAVGDN